MHGLFHEPRHPRWVSRDAINIRRTDRGQVRKRKTGFMESHHRTSHARSVCSRGQDSHDLSAFCTVTTHRSHQDTGVRENARRSPNACHGGLRTMHRNDANRLPIEYWEAFIEFILLNTFCIHFLVLSKIINRMRPSPVSDRCGPDRVGDHSESIEE